MRFSVQKEEAGGIPYSLIFGAMAVLALITVRMLASCALLLPQCPFRSLTGIPCPTCGTTRMFVSLSNGELVSAMAMNPLMGALVLSGVAAFLFGLVKNLVDVFRLLITELGYFFR